MLVQKRDLETAGVEKLHVEQVSSIGTRVQLNAALEFAREGDTLVVTKLDRLTRSTMRLLPILEVLEGKGVALKILDFGSGVVDTHSPIGKLMLTKFDAMAQFEREMMLERQREGIAKAKKEGKHKGRKPTARPKHTQVIEMHANRQRSVKIAKELGIGRASVIQLAS